MERRYICSFNIAQRIKTSSAINQTQHGVIFLYFEYYAVFFLFLQFFKMEMTFVIPNLYFRFIRYRNCTLVTILWTFKFIKFSLNFSYTLINL